MKYYIYEHVGRFLSYAVYKKERDNVDTIWGFFYTKEEANRYIREKLT